MASWFTTRATGFVVTAAEWNAALAAIADHIGHTNGGGFNYSGMGTLTFGAAGGFDDGILATPGIRFASDLDTGIFRNAANSMQVVAGGAAALTAVATGVTIPGTLAVTGALALTAGITQDAWTNITPLNLWVNNAFGAGFSALRARKDKEGYLVIEGTLSGGTTTDGTSVGTLPAGLRPASGTRKLIAVTAPHASGAPPAAQIRDDGNITLVQVTANSYLYIYGRVALD